MSIPFQDISRQHVKLKMPVDFISSIVARNACILGHEVPMLERELSAYLGCDHAICCSSGTDAITIALMALGLNPGDAVVCPSFTFIATAGAIVLAGGVPVFADIDPHTRNVSSDSVHACIEDCRRNSLNVVGVIGVDLYGLPFDRAAIQRVCQEHGVWLISDSAQSFGARVDRHSIFADPAAIVTTTSFYPYKPYSCYGDGGAIFTSDEELAVAARSIVQHGVGAGDRFNALRVGMCGRLDTVQAAVLLAKLPWVDEERSRRISIADRYDAAFRSLAQIPGRLTNTESAVSVYTLSVAPKARAGICEELANAGIGHRVYYRAPIHRQPGFAKWYRPSVPLPFTESAAESVLSLPCFAELRDEEIEQVIDVTTNALLRAGMA